MANSNTMFDGGRIQSNNVRMASPNNAGEYIKKLSNETPPPQPPQSYTTPRPSPQAQSPYKRSVELSTTHSPTPFRPMQPREFSLGGNLRRPSMVAILPGDVGSCSPRQQSNKEQVVVGLSLNNSNNNTPRKRIDGNGNSESNWNDMKQKFAHLNKPQHQVPQQTQQQESIDQDQEDDSGNNAFFITTTLTKFNDSNQPSSRRSSIYSKAMSSVTLGHISEEDTTGGTTVSSGYSATLSAAAAALEAEVEAETFAGAIVADTNAVIDQSDTNKTGQQLRHRNSALDIILGKDVYPPQYNVEDDLLLGVRGGSDEYITTTLERINIPSPVDSRRSSARRSVGKDDDHVVYGTSSQDVGNESDYDDDGISFLSWDASRRSEEHTRRSEEYTEAINQMLKEEGERNPSTNQQHTVQHPQQHVNPYSAVPQPETRQPHNSSSMLPTHSYPTMQHEQMMMNGNHMQQPQQQQTSQTNTNTQNNRPYRRLGSQNSCDSLSSHSPTPFRPMLPRELLLGNNLRRINPALPLPALPADVSRRKPSATATKWGLGSRGNMLSNRSNNDMKKKEKMVVRLSHHADGHEQHLNGITQEVLG